MYTIISIQQLVSIGVAPRAAGGPGPPWGIPGFPMGFSDEIPMGNLIVTVIFQGNLYG